MNLKQLLRRHSSDADTRRVARWAYIHKLCAINDFHLYRPHLIWMRDSKFHEAKQKWPASRGMPDDRRFFLFSTAQSVRNIPGDTADIGVRFGTSSFFILSGVDSPKKEHHLFDSFEGISEPTAEDRKGAEGNVWQKGDLSAEENICRDNLKMFPQCRFYKGWIPARFPDVKDKKFCFVHIDVDLYQPTKDSLEYFYERVSPGGAIVCDDYGFASCVGAKKAFDDFFAGKPESIIQIPTGQSLVIKR